MDGPDNLDGLGARMVDGLDVPDVPGGSGGLSAHAVDGPDGMDKLYGPKGTDHLGRPGGVPDSDVLGELLHPLF